jgi:Tfp pilus assembly protein PilW
VSLIEALIAMAIGMIAILAIFSLFTAGQKYFFNQSNRADSIDDSRFPGIWISRDIRGALQVVDTVDSYTTSSNALILQVFSLDENDMIIDGTFDFIIYRRNPDNPNFLEQIIQADAASSRRDGTKTLADNLDSLVFVYYDEDNQLTADYASIANINFVITSTKSSVGRAGQSFQESFNSWAKLRNKAN